MRLHCRINLQGDVGGRAHASEFAVRLTLNGGWRTRRIFLSSSTAYARPDCRRSESGARLPTLDPQSPPMMNFCLSDPCSVERVAIVPKGRRTYFELAMELRLWRGLQRPSPRVPCKPAVRPIATSILATSDGSFYVDSRHRLDVSNAQTPAVRRPLGEWVKSTQGDIGAGTATVHCDPKRAFREGGRTRAHRAGLPIEALSR
jgi:hypothetical protein